MCEKLGRLHFMDAMRAALMMLGVVLHSAVVFSPNQDWLIYSNDTSSAMMYLNVAIHAFRMPAFFVVSGYFCFLTLNKYRPKNFLKTRLTRILVPLLVTAITLNSLQALLLEQGGWRNFGIEHYIAEGKYISHLWFLINLVVYFIFAAMLMTFFHNILTKTGEILSNLYAFLPSTLSIFLLPLISNALLSLNTLGFPLYSELFGILNIYELIIYAPYFVFGVVLGANNKLLAKFSNVNPYFYLGLIAISILINTNLPAADEGVIKYFSIYLEFLTTWLAIAICFHLFRRYLNFSSKRIFFLSDASYTVYLFHHILVVSIGMIVVGLNMPAWPGLFTLLISVTSITLLLHRYLISQFSLTRFLFNGK